MSTRKYKFSLIELIVVLLILTVSISIVGPYSIEMIERSEIKNEELKLIQICKGMGEKAYLRDEPLIVSTKGKLMDIQTESGEPILSYQFKKLFFNEITFHISSTGFANRNTISTTSGLVIPLNTGHKK